MSKWKWRHRGRVYALKTRMWKLKLSIYKDILHAKYLMAQYKILKFIHYAVGGRPVVTEPEIEEDGDE